MGNAISGPQEAAAAVDAAAIRAAQARIASDIRHTPLMRLPGRALGLACAELWLKLEQLQVSGSFKARGMFNHLRAAAAAGALPEAGVVIASGGNAGIAAAAAARALGVPAEVFVPELTTAAKRQRLAALGAKVVVGGAAYVDALAACLERQRASGALLMHAYDLPEVIAGAGTLAAEIEDDAGTPERLLVSVGGGGLVAGLAAWFGQRCRVEALEPRLAPTLHAALEAGRPVDVAVAGLAADALGARRIGAFAWPLCRDKVAASHVLEDDAIAEAQQRLWRELRLAVEPAAALPMAALWSGLVRPAAHERVGVVLCGANFNPATLTG